MHTQICTYIHLRTHTCILTYSHAYTQTNLHMHTQTQKKTHIHGFKQDISKKISFTLNCCQQNAIQVIIPPEPFFYISFLFSLLSFLSFLIIPHLNIPPLVLIRLSLLSTCFPDRVSFTFKAQPRFWCPGCQGHPGSLLDLSPVGVSLILALISVISQ